MASALLAAMALVFVLARTFEVRHPGWLWVRAFAEAAMVGGLADWFAVTALFRHPFGLPIPHTAIIPANKDRIGHAFADFLERHFMTRTVLTAELAEIDVAAMIGNCLLEPTQRRWLASQSLQVLVSEIKPGALLADWLDNALDQRLHERLFDYLLNAASRLLDEHTDPIYRKVSEKSPRWMPRRFNYEFFLRLMDGISELLDEMRVADSAARQHFAQTAMTLRDRLASGEFDPLIAHELQLALKQGILSAHAEHGLAAFARQLAMDLMLRNRINLWARRQAVILLVRQRKRIVGIVRRVVHGWDAATVTARIEAYVGQDLQFIRINGTLVGGLVGLLLHALSL